jgi:hypothetical protein
MTTRTTRNMLAFSRPFKMKGGEGVAPAVGPLAEPAAGAPETLPREGYTQVATFLHIHRSGASQVVTVSAEDLQLFFHDGVLMPVDAVGWGRGKS